MCNCRPRGVDGVSFLGTASRPPHPGPVASRLNLTHFVDDKLVNLDCVRAVLGCECLQFARNGLGGQQSPAGQLGLVPYPFVPDWGHLLYILLGSCGH